MSISLSEEARPAPVVLGYAVAIALTAAAAAAAMFMDAAAHLPNLALVFVLPVVIAAAGFGWGPALTAAVAGVCAYNFLLIAPRYSFRVADPGNSWSLALLLIVAAIVSAVASQSRRRAVDALRQADRSAALQGLARALVGAADGPAAARAALAALQGLFRTPAAVLFLDGDALAPAAATPDADLDDAELEAARWALASRLATRGGEYPVEQARFDFWPVVSPSRTQAVIGLKLADYDRGRPEAPDRLVESVGGYLALAMERQHFAAMALEARVAGESQRLKSDLLAAVSHDLKTPLSTILFTLQSLRKFGPDYDAATADSLLALAEAETGRLSALVGNLLDMSRIDADAVVVKPMPAEVVDLVASSLHRAQTALRNRAVRTDLPAARVLIDYGLAETALANILDNAGKYALPTSPIRISARVEGDMLRLEVSDDGPGFPEPVEALFDKFARGVEGDGRPPGTGLGLAIARGFVEAFGGRADAANAPGGGAVVRLWLPLAGTP